VLLGEQVSAGVGRAEAMAEQPGVFDPLCIHMVEVGENSGTLEAVFDQWAEFKERSLALKDRVLTALMYPAFVVVVGLAVTLFLMTYVIPMLLSNLLDAGRPLPWPTRVVKGLSDLMTNHADRSHRLVGRGRCSGPANRSGKAGLVRTAVAHAANRSDGLQTGPCADCDHDRHLDEKRCGVCSSR
jgi:hypothetical protein